MAEIMVTVEMAVSKTIEGLRAIPDDWTIIGHSSNSVRVRTKAARKMVEQARTLANDLEAMPALKQIEKLSDYNVRNFIANLDPHRLHMGRWASVAVLVSGENPQRWTLTDGVLGSYVTEAAFQERLAAGLIQ